VHTVQLLALSHPWVLAVWFLAVQADQFFPGCHGDLQCLHFCRVKYRSIRGYNVPNEAVVQIYKSEANEFYVYTKN